VTKEEIEVWQLAKKHLSNRGLLEVSNHLKNDKVRMAKFYILGVIDAKVSDNKISEIEAERAYEILDLIGSDKEIVRNKPGRIQ